jgi:hypothetical protein
MMGTNPRSIATGATVETVIVRDMVNTPNGLMRKVVRKKDKT